MVSMVFRQSYGFIWCFGLVLGVDREIGRYLIIAKVCKTYVRLRTIPPTSQPHPSTAQTALVVHEGEIAIQPNFTSTIRYTQLTIPNDFLGVATMLLGMLWPRTHQTQIFWPSIHSWLQHTINPSIMGVRTNWGIRDTQSNHYKQNMQ